MKKRLSVSFAVLLFIAFLAGCGGGGGGKTVVPDQRDTSKKVINVTLHENGYAPFLPEDVWGTDMSGWRWAIYDFPDAPAHKLMYVSRADEPYCQHDDSISTDNLLSPCWHVTHGFYLDAVGINEGEYVESFKAQLIDPGQDYGIKVAPTTEVVLDINVVPDNTAELISVAPVAESTISCWDYSAFKISLPANTHIGYTYLFPMTNTGVHIGMAMGRDPVDGSAIAIPQTESGYLKPGDYILAVNYSTAWESGDYTDGIKTIRYTVKNDYFYCEHIDDYGNWTSLSRNAGRSLNVLTDKYPDVSFAPSPTEFTGETDRQVAARKLRDEARKR